MKKIFVVSVTLLTFIAGFGQSRISLLGNNDPVVISASSSNSFAPCSEENPNDGTFEEGINCSAASAFQTANDLTVAADETFTLNQITASIFANNGIASVDIMYYDDTTGIPGTLLGSELGVVPSSQAVIGSNFGFDVNEIVLDVSPFEFVGQTGAFTRYWVELSVTDGTASPDVFWVATSSSAVGEPIAQFITFWTFPNSSMDGVYIWSGECDPLLGVNDSIAKLISVYPNPTTEQISISFPASIEIKNVVLFDVLGNNTGVIYRNGSIDTAALSKGIYILSIETSEGSLNKKIIKN